MPLIDDGDLVKALGFVALYFGNLEEFIDDRIRDASSLFPRCGDSDKAVNSYSFARKVKFLRSAMRRGFRKQGHQGDRDDWVSAERTLTACFDVADKRNEAIHSSIYATKPEAIRYSRRQGVQAIFSAELIDLANRIDDLTGDVDALRYTINKLCGRPWDYDPASEPVTDADIEAGFRCV